MSRAVHAEVVVEVDASAGGFLVLNDVWHPWWRASVDGRDQPVLAANLAFLDSMSMDQPLLVAMPALPNYSVPKGATKP